MVVFRPIEMDDLEGLFELAQGAGFGLTTLPADREVLKERILDSVHGFEKISDKPGAEVYLFVLEDVSTGRIIGTSGLSSKVGGYVPFYTYQIKTHTIVSSQLKVKKEVRTLNLIEDHNGPSEIGSLYLDKRYRAPHYGKLLSLARFMFVADFRAYFDEYMIAEMRGQIDDEGKSPLWEALGRHFFCTELHTADSFTMVSKQFIADLMPKHPIYIDMLSADAQAVIGKVHPKTLPARKILEGQGFGFADEVDIFEGGPTLKCLIDDIKVIRESVVYVIGEIVDDLVVDDLSVVTNTLRNFRATLGGVKYLKNGQVAVDTKTALVLKLEVGSDVRSCVIYRPTGEAA